VILDAELRAEMLILEINELFFKDQGVAEGVRTQK